MRSSTIIIAVLSVLGGATAKKHHNCGCKVNNVYNVELSRDTCLTWKAEGEPNTRFDGYSCVDKGAGRGIDGAPWEVHCKAEWEVAHGGNRDDVRGRWQVSWLMDGG